MAAVRWQIPFKSFNGLSCRIDVYDPTFPEYISPMVYKGADDPFYFEEDNSDDLLNDVLRYQTGYIRMIDDGSQYIPDIYPTGTFDRPVNVYYGSTLVFNGYIQVQEFSTDMVPTPKVIELPVISMLGVMENRKFDASTANFMPPKVKTLGQLLDIILPSGGYDRVYLPNITGAELTKTVNTLTLTPWNKDYHHSIPPAANVITVPESYAYLVECICKAFGWICHDTPTALVFTCFDYQSNYIYYPTGHVGNNSYKVTDSTPVAAINLEDYFENADNNGQQNTILPETGIEIDYEGEGLSLNVDFDKTTYNSVITDPDYDPEDGEETSLCVLMPINMLYDMTGIVIPTFEGGSYITPGASCVAWTSYEGILMSMHDSWIVGREMFKIRYYIKRMTGISWKVTFQALHSDNWIRNLASANADELLYATATVNDEYIEISFRLRRAFNTHELVMLYNIKLECLQNNTPYASYRYKPSSDSDKLPSSQDNPLISSSITMPISLYRLNNTLIGASPLTTKITEYPYLFQKRLELVQRFRLTTAPALPHTRLFNYQGKKWRIIAQEFHPWDDEYKLTMQHSPVLTNLPSN